MTWTWKRLGALPAATLPQRPALLLPSRAIQKLRPPPQENRLAPSQRNRPLPITSPPHKNSLAVSNLLVVVLTNFGKSLSQARPSPSVSAASAHVARNKLKPMRTTLKPAEKRTNSFL